MPTINATNNEPIETAQADLVAAQPGEMTDRTLLHKDKDMDGTSGDARKLNDSTVNVADTTVHAGLDLRERRTASDSGTPKDVMVGGSENSSIEAAENSSTATAVASQDENAYQVEDAELVSDLPDEVIAIEVPSTRDLDPAYVEDNVMDLDIPETESRPQQNRDEGDSIETASVPKIVTPHHTASSSEGLGTWQIVGWPRMGPKELLQGWSWVFQYHP